MHMSATTSLERKRCVRITTFKTRKKGYCIRIQVRQPPKRKKNQKSGHAIIHRLCVGDGDNGGLYVMLKVVSTSMPLGRLAATVLSGLLVVVVPMTAESAL